MCSAFFNKTSSDLARQYLLFPESLRNVLLAKKSADPEIKQYLEENSAEVSELFAELANEAKHNTDPMAQQAELERLKEIRDILAQARILVSETPTISKQQSTK